MGNFLRDHLGVPESSLGESYQNDSDWTLVIKLHAYIESSLNLLISRHFNEPRIDDIIAEMDVGDRKKGKMAFVIALDLLPSEQRSFIHKLSELRNMLAHDVKNVNFDLKAHLRGIDPKKSKEIYKSMIPIMRSFFPGAPDNQCLENAQGNPRFAIFVCTADLMLRIYERQRVRQILAPLPDDFGKYFLGNSKPEESTPKAQ